MVELKVKKRLIILLLAIAFPLSLIELTPAAEFTLRYAFENPITHPMGRASKIFAKRVAELTNDRIAIRLYPASELGPATVAIEACQLGNIEIATGTFGNLSRFSRKFDIMSLPFLFRDYDHIKANLRGPLGQFFMQTAKEIGFEPLAMNTSGARHVYGKKPIRNLGDVRGLKIRVMEDKILLETWRALGAIPTAVSLPELYMALQMGIVDATETTIMAWLSGSYYEVAPFASRLNYADSGRMILMNAEFSKKLPKELFSALKKAWAETEDILYGFYMEDEKNGVLEGTKRGATFIDIDPVPFKKATEVVYKKFPPTIGIEWIQKIQATK